MYPYQCTSTYIYYNIHHLGLDLGKVKIRHLDNEMYDKFMQVDPWTKPTLD